MLQYDFFYALFFYFNYVFNIIFTFGDRIDFDNEQNPIYNCKKQAHSSQDIER